VSGSVVLGYGNRSRHPFVDLLAANEKFQPKLDSIWLSGNNSVDRYRIQKYICLNYVHEQMVLLSTSPHWVRVSVGAGSSDG
jgi:hypothetical protein